MTGLGLPALRRRARGCLAGLGIGMGLVASGGAEMTTRTFQDNGAELQNPDMGWALHYYDNVPANYGSRLDPADLLPQWPGLSYVYLRLPWAYVEPEEGRFNWSVVDTPMQRYRTRGLKACFRFTCSESWMEYPTPRWVQEAGAKGYRFRPGKGIQADGPFWEPDFDDPVFLEKLDHFLAAAAARYDGHPDVAFVDIGSFGVWGEGHTWSSTGKAYENRTITNHIDLHRKHFRKTTLIGMDDFLSRPGTEPTWLAGVNRRGFDLVLPFAWRGRALEVFAGLWLPGVKEQQGRLLPAGGESDRRVRLGRLAISATGLPSFASSVTLPAPADLPAGAQFAVTCLGVEHDPVQQPHSLKLRLEYRTAGTPPAAVQAFLHLVDPDSGREVCQPRAEREDEALTRYMADRGLGVRDDSILVQPPPAAYFHARMCQQFWQRAPVVIESEHYGGSAQRGCWEDGLGFLQAIEDCHASYASIHWWPHEFLEKNRDVVRRINLRIGYRFCLAEMTWPATVGLGERLRLRWSWRNAGVAPPYTDYYPTVTLKDTQGGIVAVLVSDTDSLRALPVNLQQPQPVTSEREFGLPFQLRCGTYGVFVSVGDRLGKPVIALPLADGDGARRYGVGQLTVQGDFALRLAQHAIAGGSLVLESRWDCHRAFGEGVTPFLHVERDGRLAWAGNPDVAVPADAFATQGCVDLRLALPLPALAAGESARILAGLWYPARIGHEDERLSPDQGEPDRRVLLGTLVAEAEGRLRFAPDPAAVK